MVDDISNAGSFPFNNVVRQPHFDGVNPGLRRDTAWDVKGTLYSQTASYVKNIIV